MPVRLPVDDRNDPGLLGHDGARGPLTRTAWTVALEWLNVAARCATAAAVAESGGGSLLRRRHGSRHVEPGLPPPCRGMPK